MKVLGRWATIGLAVLAFVLGTVIGAVAVLIVVPASQNFDRSSEGSSYAVAWLVSNPVYVVTLMLASRLSGPNVLAYLGLDIPRWQHIAFAIAGLAILTVFVDTLTLALGRDMVSPSMLEIYRSAQADGSLSWLWLAIVVV